jgi:hypothetical protein
MLCFSLIGNDDFVFGKMMVNYYVMKTSCCSLATPVKGEFDGKSG